MRAALDGLDQVLLSTIVRQNEIPAEPSLPIGMIAVVRRILAATNAYLAQVALREDRPRGARPGK